MSYGTNFLAWVISLSVVSLYFKQKLRSQYVNALEDAKKELVLIEQALDKIREVKQEIGEKQGEWW